VSAVVEGNGDVRPCFFHDAIGNVRRQPLDAIVRRHLRAFRATLDTTTNDTCARCVCSLKTGWRNQPWR
jgi:radical SAM protein with 4Fe4S-binding SPASM domain